MADYHQNIVCRECGKKAPHKGKGLCLNCYHKKYMVEVYCLSEGYKKSYLKYQCQQADSIFKNIEKA